MPTLHVCMAAQERSIPVTLCDDASLEDFQQAVFQKCGLVEGVHNIRLIAGGRLITSGIVDAGLQDGDYVHCAVSDVRRKDGSVLDMEEATGIVEDAGSVGDFWCGFILATLLGLIMVILCLDGSMGLSKRWQKGILYGALLNLVFGIVVLMTDNS